MAKINFNNQVNLYMNGMKMPGVLDVQVEKKKLRPVSYYGEGIPAQNYWLTRTKKAKLFADDYSKNVYSSDPVSFSTEIHQTGWRLIIFVSYDLKMDCYKFSIRYGDYKQHLKISSEFLMLYDWENNIEDQINWIAEKMEVPNSTEVIVNIHADSDIPNKIKKWSQQFDTVSYNTNQITKGMNDYSLSNEYYLKQKQLYEGIVPADEMAMMFDSPDPGFSSLSKLLPGVNEKVIPPCKCDFGEPGLKYTIRSIIIHLNDKDKWTREAIADWLDILPNEIDLNFKTPTEKEKV